MNITFLIGNGFDVGLGLRSQFKDFFPIYVEKSKNKQPTIRQLSESISEDYETWSDFETQMGKYTMEFDQTTKQQYPIQFRDFETEFIEYLRSEEKKLSFDDSKAISKMMCSALVDFYNSRNLRDGSATQISNVFSRNSGQEHKYNFISFNYTGLLEKCLETIPDGLVRRRGNYSDKIGRVIHVHGTCDDAPIMGVNDVSQIVNKDLANDQKFVRYLVKPMLNSIHRNNHDTVGADLIATSQIICVYGMALGETDQRWWERLLKWMTGGSDRQLVIFDYDPKFNTSSQFDWIDKEDSIIDKLANYANSSQMDVEALRPRIHIAVHKNIFAMNLRKQEQKKTESAIERSSRNISSLGLDFNKLGDYASMQGGITVPSLLDRETLDKIYSSLPSELK